MHTPLAWHNAAHDRPRTVVAASGIGFALVLIFMQLGFLNSVLNTAVIILDKLDADIFIVSNNYLYFSDAGSFPRSRLDQAAAVPGVASVTPFYIGTTSWRVPNAASEPRTRSRVDDRVREMRRAIMVMAFSASDPVFRAAPGFDPRSVTVQRGALERPDTLLLDRHTREEFGVSGPEAIGRVREVGLRPFTIGGVFGIGCGFTADGSMLVSDQNFQRIYGPGSLRRISLGLVRLAPGVDPEWAAARLSQVLPRDDCQVLTRGQLRAQERGVWVFEKSIGVIFLLGVVVAFLVGLAVVYQVLSTDIADHFAEYATLKAMGYGRGDITSVVTDQALFLAYLGYVPALAISWVLYRVVHAATDMPIEMTPAIVVAVLMLSVAMCWLSARFSVRKLKKADPAELF